MLFIAIQSLLYLIILTAELFSLTGISAVKFAVIALCALYALHLTASQFKSSHPLFLLIRLLTLAADYLLVIRDDHYLLAVGLFVSVEILYGILMDNRQFWKWRLTASVVMAALLTVLGRFSLLNLLALVNIVNLTFNCLDALSLRQPIWFWGFMLFWLCDVSVGAHNLLPENRIIPYAIWLFYVPSQVILCLGESINEEK